MSLRDTIIDEFSLPSETLFLGSSDGEFDLAIIGVTDREGTSVLLYDELLVIDCLMTQGLSDDEAWDWYGTNIACAHHGPHTPIYCRTIRR